VVIKAELPGIDPDKEVDLTVSDGMLLIRREEEYAEEKATSVKRCIAACRTDVAYARRGHRV